MSERKPDDPASLLAQLDEAWVRPLLEDAGLSLWTWDLESGEIWLQEDHAGVLGYAGDSLPRSQQRWAQLIHPEDREQVNGVLRQTSRQPRSSFDLECRLHAADGQWRWTRVYGRVARRRVDGRMALLAGINIDITEQRRAEEALQRSERRYRTLVENQGEGIGIVDAQERFTFANPAADEIFGVDPGKLVGRSLQELIPPEEFQRILEQTGQRRDGTRSTYEVSYVRQHDGQRRTMLVTATPQYQPDGSTYAGAFGVFRDVTAQRKAKEERKQLGEQLRQTAKMESLGQLAGGVAHDFNNLLSPILGYTELLLQDLDPADPIREDILEIEEAGNRARELTRQLTAFSRKQVLRVRVLNLNDVVTRSHDMFRRLISEDIGIELSLSPDLGNTRADEGQLQQILMNLTINARDAIEGGGTIAIETRNVDPGDRPLSSRANAPEDTTPEYVRLTIRDTGRGMEEEVCKRIFEPFFSTKHKSKGTGLGLATVHGIVRQHDGHIAVDTSPGMGSAFHVYLLRTAEQVASRRKRHETTELANHDETVLVVEDDDAVRRHVCRTLKRQGFTVLEARGGAEALERAAAHPGRIHLLVTDVVMPQLNGREVYLALRKLRPAVKVVFMSGYTDDALGLRGILDDDTVFLQKPFTRRSLITKIEEALAS